MITKKDIKQKDRLIKGVTADGHFKIAVVKTSDVVRTTRQKHGLSLLNTVLLGKALTGTMLMASELKGEERIKLRIDGDGPTGLLIAEANRVGEVRGYVQHPQAGLDYGDTSHLGEGLGQGTLTFSKVLYNEAEPRTSSIELVSGNITDDLAFYMVQSEQIPSAFLLHVGLSEEGDISEAGGVFVQRLPGAPDEKVEKLQKRLKSLEPVHRMLEKGWYIDDIMHHVLDPYEVKELDRQPVDFFCRCTRKRFVNALAMLSHDDLKEISDEGQELICHFCNEQYFVSREEIKGLLAESQARMN